ncbi:MAG: hypothetical protein GXO48_04965 [Chlorobi bacterium]|nr:hypothetical protein [Chlorobiota bacterium]
MKRCIFAILSYLGLNFAFGLIILGGLEWLQINWIKLKLNLLYSPQLEDIKWTSDFGAKFIRTRFKLSENKFITINEYERLGEYLPEKLIISEIDTFGVYSVSPHIDCLIKDSVKCSRYNLDVGVNIGSSSPIGKLMGIELRSLQDVFDSYEKISNILVTNKIYPDFNCVVDDDTILAYVLIPRYIGNKYTLLDIDWEISYDELMDRCFQGRFNKRDTKLSY